MGSAGQIIGTVVGAIVGVFLGPIAGLTAFGTIAAGAAVGFAVGGIIDPPKPVVPSFGGTGGSPLGNSQSYGWDGLRNTARPDIPVAVIYGQMRVGGNVINQSVKQNTTEQSTWHSDFSSSATVVAGLVNTIPSAGSTEGDVERIRLRVRNVYNRGKGFSVIHTLGITNINQYTIYNYKSVDYKIEIRQAGVGSYVQVAFLSGHSKLMYQGAIGNMAQFPDEIFEIGSVAVPDSIGGSFVYEIDPKAVGLGGFSSYDVRVTISGRNTDTYDYKTNLYNPTGTTFAAIKDVFSTRLDYDAPHANDTVLRMLIAIGEGEIDSIEGVEVNGNPIRNYRSLESSNSVVPRLGKIDQSVIPAFRDLEQSNTVGATLSQTFFTQATVGINVHKVRLGFTAPGGLFGQSNSTGQIVGRFVVLEIEYREFGVGSFIPLGTLRISGRGRQTLRREFSTNVLDPAGKKWEFRVKRQNAETTDTSAQDSIVWSYMTEVNEDDLSYPGTALLGVEILATDQLSGQAPSVTALCRGLKVYNPVTTVTEWTNNPAWCIRDLLLNRRYGLGDFIDSTMIDEDSFESAADYADELVDDGTGTATTHKRFEFNVVIDAQSNALDLLKDLCASFRSYLLWSDNKIKLIVDRPTAATQSFTDSDESANIIDGSFSFAFAPKGNTPNETEIQFKNQDKNYEMDTLLVQHASLEEPEDPGEPFRRNRKSIKLIGVTRPAEAARMGVYLLNNAQLNTVTAQFRASIKDVQAEVGDVVQVTHAVPGWTDRLMRIIQIERSGDEELDIKLINYDEDAYDDEHVVDFSFNTTLANPLNPPPPVIDLVLKERATVESDGTVVSGINVYFNIPWVNVRGNVMSVFKEAVIYYKDLTVEDGSEFIRAGVGQLGGENFIGPLEIGRTYQVKVTSRSNSGAETPLHLAASDSIALVGKTESPADVDNFQVFLDGGILKFTWDAVDEIDVAGYIIKIGSDWNTGVVLNNQIQTNKFQLSNFPGGFNVFMVKAVDTSGNESINEAQASVMVGRDFNASVLHMNERAMPHIKITAEVPELRNGELFIGQTSGARAKFGNRIVISDAVDIRDCTVFDVTGDFVTTEDVVGEETPAPPGVTRDVDSLLDEVQFPAKLHSTNLVGADPWGGLTIQDPYGTGAMQEDYETAELTLKFESRARVAFFVDSFQDAYNFTWDDADYAFNAPAGATRAFYGVVGQDEGKARVEMYAKLTGIDAAFQPFEPRVDVFTGASFRARMISDEIENFRPVISKMEYELATIENLDKGIKRNVPVDGVTVFFTKKFNEPPQVSASVIDGTASDIVDISDVTRESFFVKVTNNGTSVLTERSVSWIASGF